MSNRVEVLFRLCIEQDGVLGVWGVFWGVGVIVCFLLGGGGVVLFRCYLFVCLYAPLTY